MIKRKKMAEMLNRIGIKGSPEQLLERVKMLKGALTTVTPKLAPPKFPVEVYTTSEDFEDSERTREISEILTGVARDASVDRVQIHTPYFFQGVGINLCVDRGSSCWQPTVFLLRKELALARNIAESSKKPATVCFHGYHLPYETLNEQRDAVLKGLGVSVRKAIGNLRQFPESDRELIGVETMAYGLCTHEDVLVQIAEETGCFVVVDVSHLLRHFEMGKDGSFRTGEYNSPNRLKQAIETILPHTKAWHVCQHTGEPAHRDDQLAKFGIIRWEQIVPPMIASFQVNGAFAILEVGAVDEGQPLEMIGNNLSFRALVLEYLKTRHVV
jgi:hypothetical protein